MKYSVVRNQSFPSKKEKVTHPLTDNYNEFIYEFERKTNYFSFQLEKKIQPIGTRCLQTNRENNGFTYTDFFYNNETKICCFFHPYKNGICLHKIFVSPLNRRRYLGSKLMEIIKEISNRTGTMVYLIPVQTDDISLGILRDFYHKFGYRRENMKSIYWSYNPNKNESRTTLGLIHKMVG